MEAMRPRSAPVSPVHVRRSRGAGALLTAALVAGCNPIYYAPNTQNVPLLGAAHDWTLSGSLDGNRIEVQGAYAPSGSLALQVDAGRFAPGDEEDGDGGSGSFFEGGVGAFGAFGGRFTWEVWGLVGSGSFENHFPSSVTESPGTTGDISGKLLRFGVQPSAGLRTRHFEAALSTRLVEVSYRDVEGSFVFQGRDQVADLQAAPTQTLLEPALTVRGGLPRVKLQLQLARSFNLTDSDFQQDDGLLTVGLLLRR